VKHPVSAVPGAGHVPRRVRVAGDWFHGRVPAGAIYVARAAPGLPASRYANPHRLGSCRSCGDLHADRAAVVAAYVLHLAARPDLQAAAADQLAGADLACWCPPDVPCHADVLLAIATPPPRRGGRSTAARRPDEPGP